MTAFMLVFTIVTSAGPIDFVVDSGITGEDCIERMQDYESQAKEAGGYVACEFDYAHN